MPLDAQFFEVAEPMRVPSMGTEHVALLLYSLIVMLRPRSVLEVGAGYSTLFLARALADVRSEAGSDYLPSLHVIDDLSYPGSSAAGVQDALDRLGVTNVVNVVNADFRGASTSLPVSALPLDFVWFDCRAATDAGVSFLNEYWPLVRAEGGLVALHSLFVPLQAASTAIGSVRVPSPLLNELRKRQSDAGRRRTFELMSLVEPHKMFQGDVTLLSKLGGLDHIRDSAFEVDEARFRGVAAGRLIPL